MTARRRDRDEPGFEWVDNQLDTEIHSFRELRERPLRIRAYSIFRSGIRPQVILLILIIMVAPLVLALILWLRVALFAPETKPPTQPSLVPKTLSPATTRPVIDLSKPNSGNKDES